MECILYNAVRIWARAFPNHVGVNELIIGSIARSDVNPVPNEMKPKGPCTVRRIALRRDSLLPIKVIGALAKSSSTSCIGTDQPFLRRSKKRLGTIVQVLIA